MSESGSMYKDLLFLSLTSHMIYKNHNSRKRLTQLFHYCYEKKGHGFRSFESFYTTMMQVINGCPIEQLDIQEIDLPSSLPSSLFQGIESYALLDMAENPEFFPSNFTYSEKCQLADARQVPDNGELYRALRQRFTNVHQRNPKQVESTLYSVLFYHTSSLDDALSNLEDPSCAEWFPTHCTRLQTYILAHEMQYDNFTAGNLRATFELQYLVSSSSISLSEEPASSEAENLTDREPSLPTSEARQTEEPGVSLYALLDMVENSMLYAPNISRVKCYQIYHKRLSEDAFRNMDAAHLLSQRQLLENWQRNRRGIEQGSSGRPRTLMIAESDIFTDQVNKSVIQIFTLHTDSEKRMLNSLLSYCYQKTGKGFYDIYSCLKYYFKLVNGTPLHLMVFLPEDLAALNTERDDQQVVDCRGTRGRACSDKDHLCKVCMVNKVTMCYECTLSFVRCPVCRTAIAGEAIVQSNE